MVEKRIMSSQNVVDLARYRRRADGSPLACDLASPVPALRRGADGRRARGRVLQRRQCRCRAAALAGGADFARDRLNTYRRRATLAADISVSLRTPSRLNGNSRASISASIASALSPSAAGEDEENVSTRRARSVALTSMRGLDPDGLDDAKSEWAEHIIGIAMRVLTLARAHQQLLVRPAAPRRVVILQPRIAAVAGRERRADHDRAAGRDQPREHRSERAVVHPVQRAADGDDIEAADIGGQVLGFAFDEGHVSTRPLGRGARSRKHRGLGVDADDAADIGRKAERERRRVRCRDRSAHAVCRASASRRPCERTRPGRAAGIARRIRLWWRSVPCGKPSPPRPAAATSRGSHPRAFPDCRRSSTLLRISHAERSMIPSFEQRDELLKGFARGAVPPRPRRALCRGHAGFPVELSRRVVGDEVAGRPRANPRASRCAEGAVLVAAFRGRGLSSLSRPQLHDLPHRRDAARHRREARAARHRALSVQGRQAGAEGCLSEADRG